MVPDDPLGINRPQHEEFLLKEGFLKVFLGIPLHVKGFFSILTKCCALQQMLSLKTRNGI